jgi:hypothetical protein
MPRQQCALSIGLDGKIYFLEATNMIAPKLYELSLTMFFYVDRKIQDACPIDTKVTTFEKYLTRFISNYWYTFEL